MRLYKLLFFICALSLSGCTPSYLKTLKKDMIENPTTQMDKDKNLILQNAIDRKMELTAHSSGIYYTMTKEGTGDSHPTKESMITAHYGGTLMNGEKFDSSFDRGEPLEFRLAQVVQGWQIAIPLLKKGGRGTFYIPSELAYGARAVGTIPANSVLVFDIELVDFK